MTSKADFTEDEWKRLKRAPFVAGMAISLADPGGPIELYHETAAALKSVTTAATGGHSELVDAIAREAAADAKERRNPLAGFKPTKGVTAGVEIVDELTVVYGIAQAKATPEEVKDLREWILSSAQDAANAAKEGGFLGFHAVRVSEGEQRMLDRLAQALPEPQA